MTEPENQTKYVLIGKKWILEYNRRGFTLWDKGRSRWVIDGSCLIQNESFTISSEIFKNQAECMSGREITALYPRPKPKKITKRKK